MRGRLTLRFPLAWFTILAVLLGGVVIYLVVQGIAPRQMAMASVLSASLSGLVVTALDQGTAGLKAMLRRLLIWRVGIGYWLFALLFVPVLIAAGSFLNPYFGGQLPSLGSIDLGFEIVLLLFAFLLVSGLGQELGWTGFLITRLQSRYSALTAALIRAGVAWIWHLPLYSFARGQPAALANFPYGGWIAQVGFVPAVMILPILFLIPWSILFVWLYNNTGGSLLLVSVLHGSEFLGAYWMLYAGIDPTNLNNYFAHGLLMLLAAIVIVARNGRQNLSRDKPGIGR